MAKKTESKAATVVVEAPPAVSEVETTADKKQVLPVKLVVAFTTKLVSDDTQVPAFEAPGNYKDPDKIAAYVEDKKREFLAKARNLPYTGTFDEVRIINTATREAGVWRSAERGPDSGKQPVCLAVRNWLLKQFPNAWPHTTHPSYINPPQAIFIGFNVRLFVKMLGIECSLPQHNTNPKKLNVLPLSMWFSNSDHRDIGHAVIPTEFERDLDLATVLKLRGITPVASWTGPGADTAEDIRIAFELAAQLGMFCEI